METIINFLKSPYTPFVCIAIIIIVVKIVLAARDKK